MKRKFHEHVKYLQTLILDELHKLDPGLQVQKDVWQRQDAQDNPGGGGLSAAIMGGQIFESGGVNTSCVFGAISESFAQKLPGDSTKLWASGISLILHPSHPKVPTVHMNFRMIQQGDNLWFGGGADLTPFYPHLGDFHFFHQTWAQACAPYNCYTQMKKACDEYFVNHHRQAEMRGIGGIFFDHYNSGDFEHDYKMVTELSQAFLPSYLPIVEKRQHEPFTAADEDFMLHRRGRYVEFNLLHDRGTLFGLKTNGRTESILVSLPRRCKFTYGYQPEASSPQAEMMNYYQPRNWLDS